MKDMIATLATLIMAAVSLAFIGFAFSIGWQLGMRIMGG